MAKKTENSEELKIETAVDGEIRLKRPILINGEKVSTLTYNMDEVTIDLQARAEAEAKKNALRNSVYAPAMETDYIYHTYLGMAAILAVNPSYDWADLKRIKGQDIKLLSYIGRSYFFGLEESDENELDDAYATTPDISTQA